MRHANCAELLPKTSYFSPLEARRLGVPYHRLERLLLDGAVVSHARGVFGIKGFKLRGLEHEFAICDCFYKRKSYIGGLSALFYYGLLAEDPKIIWIVTPAPHRSSHRGFESNRKTLSTIRQYNPEDIISKNGFKIVSLEQALLDGLWFHRKMGLINVLSACSTALIKKKTTEDVLRAHAAKIGLSHILERYWLRISNGVKGIPFKPRKKRSDAGKPAKRVYPKRKK